MDLRTQLECAETTRYVLLDLVSTMHLILISYHLTFFPSLILALIG